MSTPIETWRKYLDDEYIRNWIEIFEAIIDAFESDIEESELIDAIADASTEIFKLNLSTTEQEKYLNDSTDEDILIKIFLQVYKPHIPKQYYEKPYLKLFGPPEILQIVDFCDKYITDKPNPHGSVINQTNCIGTKYPELDVNCNCFRHSSHVVHGKWFWEKNDYD